MHYITKDRCEDHKNKIARTMTDIKELSVPNTVEGNTATTKQ